MSTTPEPSAVTETEINRLFWQSRRGMLELDVLLVPFTREVFAGLQLDDQERYRRLLQCEDADLFQWFMGKSQPEDPELRRMVEMIIERVQPD